MSMYLKIEGIEGHVSAKGHENWIEIESICFSVNRTIHTKPGNVADRESTRPNIQEITLKKWMDKTTPLLFIESCTGKAKPKAEIHICQTSDSITPYMEYTLSNVLISHYEMQAENQTQNGLPHEYIYLNFDKIEMKYTPYDNKHQPESPILAGYDLSTAQKV